MKILITGSNGFLGKALAEKLKLKHDVTGYDLPMDICNSAELREAMKGQDIVIHSAAVADLNHSAADPDKNFNVNIRGTENVAREAARAGAHLMYISTCCAYGNAQPADELTVPEPTELYASSKLAGEYICRQHTRNLTVLRMGTMFGPGMRPALFIYKVIDAVYNSGQIDIYSDGEQSRQYLYIQDAVDIIDQYIQDTPVGFGEIVNICGKDSVSVNELVIKTAQVLKRPVTIRYVHGRGEEEIRDQEIFCSYIDSIGDSRTTFWIAFEKTLKWYLDSQNWEKE